MNEVDFINNYLKNKYSTDETLILGIGDDAGTLRVSHQKFWHISTDILLENKHFFSNESPQDLAYKALAVNFSDMAAMGANPKWLLLSMALPKLDSVWLDSFFEVFHEVLKNYQVKLMGGDTTKGEILTLSITIIGESDGMGLQRNQAQVGDDIWVTGNLGLAAAALDHHWKKVMLSEDEFTICEQARVHPIIRVTFMSRARNLIHAAQDISDGLLHDLGHILTASNLGAKIQFEDIPSLHSLKKYIAYYDWLLNGGDDYELIFTADKDNQNALKNIANQHGVLLSKIGEITQNCGCVLQKESKKISYSKKGFDHFEE